jgi:ferric-dicitrate binding protein FerR (iron transport regulator)
LDSWLAKSKENEKTFQQVSLLYQYVGQADAMPSFDTEKALSKFKNYINTSDKGACPLAEHSPSFLRKQESPANNTSPNPSKRGEHSLPFGEGWGGVQTRNDVAILKPSYFLKAAAVAAILLVSSSVLFYFLHQSAETIQLLAAENTEEYKLFENANVTLYSGSKIVYNAKSKREIQLKGKATFNINSKTSEGIVIQAGETYIKDIGTVFTVDASNSDKSITVAVSQGEVLFYTNTNKGICLKSAESAIYDVQTKQFTMVVVETQCVASLPELIFQNTPLIEAIDILKKHYSVDIIIKENVPLYALLNVSFAQNESLENVLEIITATISANLVKKDGVYVITNQ